MFLLFDVDGVAIIISMPNQCQSSFSMKGVGKHNGYIVYVYLVK